MAIHETLVSPNGRPLSTECFADSAYDSRVVEIAARVGVKSITIEYDSGTKCIVAYEPSENTEGL